MNKPPTPGDTCACGKPPTPGDTCGIYNYLWTDYNFGDVILFLEINSIKK